MTRRTTVALSMAVAALGLAGCKTSTASSHTRPAASIPASISATTDPATSASTSPAAADKVSAGGSCLISRAEASAVFGSDAGAPTNQGGQCTYATSAGSLTIITTPYGAAAAQSFDGVRSATKSLPGFQDVTGVGDRAFLNDGLFVFLKGPNVVTIDVTQASKPTAAAMTTLGQDAAGRA